MKRGTVTSILVVVALGAAWLAPRLQPPVRVAPPVVPAAVDSAPPTIVQVPAVPEPPVVQVPAVPLPPTAPRAPAAENTVTEKPRPVPVADDFWIDAVDCGMG